MAASGMWQYCDNLRVSTASEGAGYMSSLQDIYRGSQLSLECFRKSLTLNSNNESSLVIDQLHREIAVTADGTSFSDIWIVVAMAIAWTLLRFALELFVSKPLASWAGILPKTIPKFNESSFKFLSMLSMWSFAAYIAFFKGNDYFSNPMSVFVSDGSQRSFDLSLLYAIEVSFYIQETYATLYLIEIRKDHSAVMLHHFVTLSLLAFSNAVGCLKIGALVLLVYQCDAVVLELGKLCSFMHQRTNVQSAFFGRFYSVLAATFVIQWIVLRLYFHVTKIQRAATLGYWLSSASIRMPPGLHIVFIALLLSLYGLNLYWFTFIARFTWRTLRDRKVVGDVRDDDEKSKKSN